MRAPSLTGHSRNPRPIVAMISAHKGQASQVAVRKSIPLAPPVCSLAPSITITTLQRYRLPNVTTTVTRRMIRGEQMNKLTGWVGIACLFSTSASFTCVLPVWPRTTGPERIEFLMRVVVLKKDFL
jgi:hypothetical protein